jgi:hypothetical protein
MKDFDRKYVFKKINSGKQPVNEDYILLYFEEKKITDFWNELSAPS